MSDMLSYVVEIDVWCSQDGVPICEGFKDLQFISMEYGSTIKA